jgi:hypothetical protein
LSPEGECGKLGEKGRNSGVDKKDHDKNSSRQDATRDWEMTRKKGKVSLILVIFVVNHWTNRVLILDELSR